MLKFIEHRIGATGENLHLTILKIDRVAGQAKLLGLFLRADAKKHALHSTPHSKQATHRRQWVHRVIHKIGSASWSECLFGLLAGDRQRFERFVLGLQRIAARRIVGASGKIALRTGQVVLRST